MLWRDIAELVVMVIVRALSLFSLFTLLDIYRLFLLFLLCVLRRIPVETSTRRVPIRKNLESVFLCSHLVCGEFGRSSSLLRLITLKTSPILIKLTSCLPSNSLDAKHVC